MASAQGGTYSLATCSVFSGVKKISGINGGKDGRLSFFLKISVLFGNLATGTQMCILSKTLYFSLCLFFTCICHSFS